MKQWNKTSTEDIPANCSAAQGGKVIPCPHGLYCGRGIVDLNLIDSLPVKEYSEDQSNQYVF